MSMRRSASRVRGVIIGLMVGLLGISAARAAEGVSLASRIAGLVGHPKLAKMRLGVRVETLGAEPSLIYEHLSNERFKPASNQKLLVASAALCRLPPGFTYRTLLARRGNDLVIIGSGDPSVGDPRMARQAQEPITAVFHAWADKLKALGLTRIEGDLLYDDYIFEQQHMHPKWPAWFNLEAWYTAPVGGLNFNDNCVDVVIKPGSRPGLPARVTLIPPETPWVKLRNKATTATKGEPVVRRLGDGPITISVAGSVSKPNSADSPLSIPVVDPGAFFANTCRTALAARGIKIVGQTRRQRMRQPGEKLPADLQIVAVHERKLADLLWRVNKSSLNMFAEALLKTLGAYAGPGKPPRQGTLAGGQGAVRQFLGSLGLSEDLYVLDDGSGLSHDNRAAPIVLTTVLQHMDRHPQRDLWWANLSTPGEKYGTLAKRMKDLKGKVFAKTGHIGGVSTLSGYVLGNKQRRYVFSVLCNDTNKVAGGSGEAHRLQERICRLLNSWDNGVSGP